MKPARIDAVIVARNEHDRIGASVRHAARIGPAYVVDVGSSDGTADAARAAGAAQVVSVPADAPDPWARAMGLLPLEGEWVLLLYADERVTPALRGKLWRAAESSTPLNAFRFRRLVVFSGRVVRWGGFSSRGVVRFIRRGAVTFQPARRAGAYERPVVPGAVGRLDGDLLHVRRESLSRAIQRAIERADIESAALLDAGAGTRVRAPGPALGPFLAFFRMYFLRLGFLDGRAGLHLAFLTAAEEYMKRLLLRERLLAAHAAASRSPASGAAAA